jgi:hypothetical protein
MSKLSAKFWVYVNKNGFLGLSIDKPVRDEDLGKWVAKYPYCNSIMYAQVMEMISKTKFGWNCEPEYIEINYK